MVKMISSSLFQGIRTARTTFIFKRNKGETPTDPIQKLFIEKIRDYRSRSQNGAFVDPSPDIQKELKFEMTKLDKNYGGGPNVDMTAFPTFKFGEPKIDPIDITKPKPKAQEKKKEPEKKKPPEKKKGGKK
ncbi:unnamed protein product [Chrysodeixis includens]|uniref:ATP synthase-coupling factor 6, mitochondrial n=1 Tax=Chrysodeixis includens TaxID=689277 RepID=A0A9N8PYM7_CHRIL|nr:unnamed protein product [Chrysodeixis includens]